MLWSIDNKVTYHCNTHLHIFRVHWGDLGPPSHSQLNVLNNLISFAPETCNVRGDK
jgi:hypothetical protein